MKFHVPNISCNHCKKRVMAALESVQGIEHVEVNIEDKNVEVSGNFDADIIKKVLQGSGYPVIE